MRGTLVIPTLNEAASIGHVVRGFRAAGAEANATYLRDRPIDWEVLVVDGRSTDGTPELARDAGARVLFERRPGYGRAYRTAFAELSGDLVATMDGDATYPVAQVPRFAQHLLDSGVDFVSADRLSRLRPQAMTTEHRIGNRLLNSLLAIAYRRYLGSLAGGRLRDSQSGMWVFRREILPELTLTQEGMPLSEEIKIEVLLHGFRLEEIPIDYAERWGAPKLSSWRDGRANLVFLLRKRLEIARARIEPVRRSGGPV